MTKDVIWFKHDADASSDLAIEAMLKRYGYAGFGLYWEIIGRLRRLDYYRMRYSDVTFDGLAKNEYETTEKVKKFIDDCIDTFQLFKKDGEDYFYSERLRRDMNDMVERRNKQSAGGIKGAKKRYGLSSKPEPPRKQAKQKIEDTLIPGEPEIKLLQILKTLPGWDYQENDDLGWLRELMQDFNNVTPNKLKECLDYHSENPVSNKGPWKNRIRQWLSHDKKYKEGEGGTHKRSTAQGSQRFDPKQPLR